MAFASERMGILQARSILRARVVGLNQDEPRILGGALGAWRLARIVLA